MDYEYLADDYMGEEVPRRVKKKPAKKKAGKSNHKHSYKDCLVKENGHLNSYLLGKYCTICGKLVITELFDTENINASRFSKVLSDVELLEKYSNYEIITVDDIVKTKNIKL